MAFDPSTIEDDLAMQTDWGPAHRKAGASFRTHQLELVDSFQAKFCPTRRYMVFCLIFLVVGLGLMFGFGFAFLSGKVPADSDSPLPLLIPTAVGFLFALPGGWLLFDATKPIIFDKHVGDFWKGRASPVDRWRQRGERDRTRLDRIHALQLIAERCRSSRSSYLSYELNLVLTDGERINVVDHGDLLKLQQDAEVLGRFLQRPVWDATGQSSSIATR